MKISNWVHICENCPEAQKPLTVEKNGCSSCTYITGRNLSRFIGAKWSARSLGLFVSCVHDLHAVECGI